MQTFFKETPHDIPCPSSLSHHSHRVEDVYESSQLLDSEGKPTQLAEEWAKLVCWCLDVSYRVWKWGQFGPQLGTFGGNLKDCMLQREQASHMENIRGICHLPVCVCMSKYLLFLSTFKLGVSFVFQEKLGIHKPKKIKLVVECWAKNRRQL